jgi:hypothetical protein
METLKNKDKTAATWIPATLFYGLQSVYYYFYQIFKSEAKTRAKRFNFKVQSEAREGLDSRTPVS